MLWPKGRRVIQTDEMNDPVAGNIVDQRWGPDPMGWRSANGPCASLTDQNLDRERAVLASVDDPREASINSPVRVSGRQ